MFQRSFLHHHSILSFPLYPHLMNNTPSPLASWEFSYLYQEMSGFVISTFLLHPNILVSLQYPSSLSFFTPWFSLTSDFLHLYQLHPHSLLPSTSFTAKPLTPVLLGPDIYTCIPSTQQLYNICSYGVLIGGVCIALKPSSQPLCI